MAPGRAAQRMLQPPPPQRALSAFTGHGALERALLDVAGAAAHHVASFVW